MFEDAFRTLLEVRPVIKINLAIEMYRNERYPLHGLLISQDSSQEGFKNVIAQRG